MVTPVGYVREVAQELRKVSWPTFAQTRQMTLLVIFASLAVAVYVGALDYVFSNLMRLLINS